MKKITLVFAFLLTAVISFNGQITNPNFDLRHLKKKESF